MSILTTVLVTFFAGMGAGLGTGFAGMSAAAVISPMVAFSGAMPSDSPQAVRTAGATCTTVISLGSAKARYTSAVSSRSRRPPTGQWVTHWPHSEQSESLITILPETSMVVRPPVPARSHTLRVCTFSQI